VDAAALATVIVALVVQAAKASRDAVMAAGWWRSWWSRSWRSTRLLLPWQRQVLRPLVGLAVAGMALWLRLPLLLVATSAILTTAVVRAL
jgi:hypothetical protein